MITKRGPADPALDKITRICIAANVDAMSASAAPIGGSGAQP